MKYNEAIRELQFDKNKKFVLLGEEYFLKEQFEKYLIDKHIDTPVMCFYPGDEQEAKSSLYSSGLFEDRIVLLRYFDQMKNKGFSELAKKFDGYLIVTLSEKVNLKSAAITELVSSITPVHCNKMSGYGSEYPSWILSQGTAKGFNFIDGAEDAFYRKVGPDLSSILNELSKLMIYKKETKVIFPEDIEKVVTQMASGSAFDFLDNLLRKDILKMLVSLDGYLQGNDDISELIWFLTHNLEKMYRLVLMDEQKISADGMASILNMSPFIIKTRYLPRVKSLGKNKIAKWIESVGDLEARFRDYKGDKKILFSNFIFSIAVG